jgi:Icc-related predicted phosphoesterase
MKDSRPMNLAFSLAIKREFKEHAEQIESAIKEFLLSQALAVKTENCIWISHSLPSDRMADQFNTDVFNRKLTKADCIKPGSAYILTWGRRMSQTLLNKMAQMLKVEVFILGHQPQTDGWDQAGENLVIIASDHNHGCLVHINLDKYYSAKHIIKAIKPLSSLT